MGFRIPHFQHFPPFASIIFLSFLIFQHPPCSPPGALPSGRAGNAGNKPPVGRMVCPSFPVPHGFSPWAPAWQELYVPQTVKCRGAGGGIPWRHLLSLPRGRGPSQTPKFLSPGPPLSLAAGFAYREPSPFVFAENPRASSRRMPDWQVEPVQPGFSPLGYLFGRLCKCRRRFNVGVPGAKPPAK